jgi:hypothetical protein
MDRSISYIINDATIIAWLGQSVVFWSNKIQRYNSLRIKVTDRRETSKLDRGVVKRQLHIVSQRGEVIQKGIQASLVKRKPQ